MRTLEHSYMRGTLHATKPQNKWGIEKKRHFLLNTILKQRSIVWYLGMKIM